MRCDGEPVRLIKPLATSATEPPPETPMALATPEIVSGLRIGFAVTFLGVLIGEVFASQRGLGFLVINGISSHNVRLTTAVTLMIVVFAVAANWALLAIAQRVHR